MHEVLARGQLHDPEEEETVSVRVLGFLPPLLCFSADRRDVRSTTRLAARAYDAVILAVLRKRLRD